MKSERLKIALSSAAFRRIIACCFVCLSICLGGGASFEVFAQKTRRIEKSPDSGRGKTGTRVKQQAPEPKEAQPLIKQVIVPPNEGYLALTTTSEANVQLRGLKKGGRSFVYKANKQGLLSLEGLTPGNYQLEITREDFTPITETIAINRGKQTPLVRFLVSQYGTIILGMGGQAAVDVTVRLNNQPVEPPRIRVEEGKVYVKRVPIGPQEISVSKPGYEPWSQQRVIQPGECDNLVTITLFREAITLTVKSQPQAEVYIDDVMKGLITAEGAQRIPDIAPGEYRLRVSFDGFETVERKVRLTLENREPVEEVPLVLLADETEFNATFDPRISEWSPASQKGWELRAGGERGVRISGEAFALASNTRRPNRSFNIYGDFTFLLNVRFDNGKGAAWVVRAKDERNYYLFELNKQERRLKFYVCQNGKCDLKRNDEVFADIDEVGASFRIRLEARGNKLIHTITTRNGEGNLGGEIVDDAFRYGGAGLCAINGLEMFVNEFKVIPLK